MGIEILMGGRVSGGANIYAIHPAQPFSSEEISSRHPSLFFGGRRRLLFRH